MTIFSTIKDVCLFIPTSRRHHYFLRLVLLLFLIGFFSSLQFFAEFLCP